MTTEPCDGQHGYLRNLRYVGTYADHENDRLDWDVTVERCDRCGQTWILERTEDTAFSRSGRWRRARITNRLEECLNEENFEKICTTRIKWHLYYGAYCDGPQRVERHDWGEPNDADDFCFNFSTNIDLPTSAMADESKVTSQATELPFWRVLIRRFWT